MEQIPSIDEFDPNNPDEKVLYWARATLEQYLRNGQYHVRLWEQIERTTWTEL